VHLLTVGWPLGRRAMLEKEARQFVRDPEGNFPNRLLGTFSSSGKLPPDAFFSGYQHRSDELWLAEATADVEVYLVRGGVVEVWPRADELFACG
jgi:hypothetical protein